MQKLSQSAIVVYGMETDEYVKGIVETALKKEKIWDNQEKNFHIFWIKNVAKELSEYASTSYSETIGEAFAEYIDSKKPRAWAQAICKEIKHRLTSQ